MKTLKFMPNLVEMVLSGKKTTTWRLFDDKDLQVGDQLLLINKDTMKEFAKAEVVSVATKPLGQADASDYDGHETYLSKDEMIKTFQGYYGERVNEDTELKVVRFKLLEKL